MPLTLAPRESWGERRARYLTNAASAWTAARTMTRTKATTSKERRYEHPPLPRTSAEAFPIGPEYGCAIERPRLYPRTLWVTMAVAVAYLGALLLGGHVMTKTTFAGKKNPFTGNR